MKGRLIVRSKPDPPWPREVCCIPLKDPMPAGWEELHAVRSMLEEMCTCGHPRGHHIGHRHQCMVLGEEPCRCKGFTEA